MPVRIRRLKRGCRVYEGKKVSAKRTSCTKAKKQARLLRGLAHGMRLRRK